MNNDESAQNLEEIISKSLQTLGKEFLPGEIACHVLTGGAESALRDKLVYCLQRHFEASHLHFLATKEWRKIDLCIIDQQLNDVRITVQIKACYSHDILLGKNWCRYQAFAEADTFKAAAAIEKYCESSNPKNYHLFLVSDPNSAPQTKMKGVVTYADSIARTLALYPDKNLRTELLCQRVSTMFANFGHPATGSIAGGRQFGAVVDLYYWLISMPFSRSTSPSSSLPVPSPSAGNSGGRDCS